MDIKLLEYKVYEFKVKEKSLYMLLSSDHLQIIIKFFEKLELCNNYEQLKDETLNELIKVEFNNFPEVLLTQSGLPPHLSIKTSSRSAYIFHEIEKCQLIKDIIKLINLLKERNININKLINEED